MKIVSITKAKQNLFQLVSDVNKGFNPIQIVNNNGKNAVLISESDWKDIEETIYLNSIPDFVNSIMESEMQYSNNCSIYKKNEQW